LIFAVALCFAWASFFLLGYSLLGLGLYFLLFGALCIWRGMENSVAMLSVLITHFWVEKSMAPTLIANELGLLVIGVGMGVLLNLFLPVSEGRIRTLQQELDGLIQSVLRTMAEGLECGCEVDWTALSELEKSLARAEAQAERTVKNALWSDLRYYQEYVDLRKNQFYILKRMQAEMAKLQAFPAQTGQIIHFLREIADSFHETNNADLLVQDAADIRASFRQSELPKTREEFEARACLYYLFGELEHFLLLKQAFARTLTKEQKKKYWGEKLG